MSKKIARLGPLSPEAPSSAEPVRARILLVDDAPANLLALQAILEPLEQELARARTRQEGRRRAEGRAPGATPPL